MKIRSWSHFLLLLVGTTTLPAAFGGEVPLSPDSGLKIIQTTSLEFPPSLALDTMTRGRVEVVITVGPDSQLTDALVLRYSNVAFVKPVLEALHNWTYEAARKDGQPVGVRKELTFDFEARGRVVTMTPSSTLDSLIDRPFAYMVERVCRPDELDEPVTRIESPSPPWNPSEIGEVQQVGVARVDFYIDEEGRPRMPVVLSADDPAYALAAVRALERWRFSPPRRNGQPIAVRAVQQFVFPSKT